MPSQCESQLATAGMSFVSDGSITAFMAPQWVWPHTMMSDTARASTAYSMVPASPEGMPHGGTMLPALRTMNRSPGSVCVIRFGTIRESEQVMKSASGSCRSTSRRKRSRCAPNMPRWKRLMPSTRFRMSPPHMMIR